jgi:hypothetical protein
MPSYKNAVQQVSVAGGHPTLRLAVIDCEHVGLVTGSCLAKAGHEVFATDNDVARIATLNAG